MGVHDAPEYAAELRYNDLERKSLLEMDHLRQIVKMLEKEVRQAKSEMTINTTKFIGDVTALKCKLSAQNQKNLTLTEMLSDYKRTLKSTEKKLSTVTIKYESNKSNRK